MAGQGTGGGRGTRCRERGWALRQQSHPSVHSGKANPDPRPMPGPKRSHSPARRGGGGGLVPCRLVSLPSLTGTVQTHSTVQRKQRAERRRTPNPGEIASPSKQGQHPASKLAPCGTKCLSHTAAGLPQLAMPLSTAHGIPHRNRREEGAGTRAPSGKGQHGGGMRKISPSHLGWLSAGVGVVSAELI